MRARLRSLVALALAGGVAVLVMAGSASSAARPTLKVMVLTQWDTGFLDLKDLPIIVDNAAQWANTHGGIRGANIQVIPCNDHNDANEAEKCARDAVSQGVVALIGGFTLYGPRVFPILEQAGIPWLGLISVQPIDNTSPNSFPVTGGPLLGVAPGALAARSCKRPALVTNSSSVTTSLPYVTAGVKSQGRDLVATTLIPSGASDMAPFVTQMTSKNPDCIISSVTEATLFQLIPALKAAGALGKYRFYTSNPGQFTDRIGAQFPTETNGWFVVGYFPLVDRPVWRDYVKIQKHYNNLGSYLPNIGSGSEQRSYIGFKIMQQVMAKMKGPITGPTFLNALNHSCNVRLAGMAPKFNFCKEAPVPALKRLFNTKFTFYKVKNGKFTMLQSGFQEMLQNYVRGTK